MMKEPHRHDKYEKMRWNTADSIQIQAPYRYGTCDDQNYSLVPCAPIYYNDDWSRPRPPYKTIEQRKENKGQTTPGNDDGHGERGGNKRSENIAIHLDSKQVKEDNKRQPKEVITKRIVDNGAIRKVFGNRKTEEQGNMLRDLKEELQKKKQHKPSDEEMKQLRKIGENLTSLKLSEIGKILPDNNLFPSVDLWKSKRILGLEPDNVMTTGNKTEDGRLLDRFKPTRDDSRVTMSLERVTFKK